MRTKRILTILLVVALTIVCGAIGVAAQDNANNANSFQMAVEVSSSTALAEELCILKPGDSVEVSVMITENTGLKGVFAFDIIYDANALDVVLTEDDTVDFTAYNLLGEDTAENVLMIKGDGVLTYRAYGLDKTIKPTGKLVTLKFIVKETFEGKIDITVDGYQNNITFADGTFAFVDGNATANTNVVIKDSNTEDYEGATIIAHSYGEPIVQEATCTSEGTVTYPCATCDEQVVIKTADMLPHTPGAEATCTTNQICTVCENELVAAKGHTPVPVEGKEATCEEDGYTGKTICSVCEEQLESEVIPAKGHTPGAEATCTTNQICTVCEAELAPAKGHTPGAEATCTTNQACTVCEAELAPAKGHTPGADATCTTNQVCTVCEAELAPAKGHTTVVVPAVEATCTATGLTEGSVCSVCEATLVAQTEVAKKDHTYGDWQVTKEATKKEEGSKAKACTACGDVVTESIPVLESNGAWIWIVIVAVVVVAGGGFCLYWFVFRKKN